MTDNEPLHISDETIREVAALAEYDRQKALSEEDGAAVRRIIGRLSDMNPDRRPHLHWGEDGYEGHDFDVTDPDTGVHYRITVETREYR